MRLAAFSLNAALALATIACSSYRGRAIDPIFSKVGTGTLLHPIQEPDIVASDCPATKAAKEHIHIFAVNGLNPLCLGNFNGLCEYLKRQGYTNTYFGQLYTCTTSPTVPARSGRPTRKQKSSLSDSASANSVRTIANDLAKDGTSVDLLVYMVGDYVYNKPASRPDNVKRILNIRAQGIVWTGGDLMFNGDDIDGARNHRLNVRHILVPSRRETLELLTNELASVVAETKPTTPTASPVKELPPTIAQRGTSPYNGR